MIKLVVNNESNVEVVEFFETVEATVDYLKRTDLVSWQKDEDPEANDLDLTNVETLQQLEAALEEVKLSWWEIEVEEISEKEAVEQYLANYDKVKETTFRDKLNFTSNDEKDYADAFEKDELYVYDNESFKEFLNEKEELDDYDKEALATNPSIVLDNTNVEGYTFY